MTVCVCMESGGIWLCFLEGTGFIPRADYMRVHLPGKLPPSFSVGGLILVGYNGDRKVMSSVL